MTEARVTRVSSAIDLDLTAVVEETARLVLRSVSQVVAEQTMPTLARMEQKINAITALLTAPALGVDDTVATLACHLPSGTPMTGETARFQAERLLAAGYGIVPIQGAALEHSVGSVEVSLPVLPSPEQVRDLSAREAVQLADQMNQRDVGWRDERTGLVSVPLDEVESFVSGLASTEQRADARLAEANLYGGPPADSRRED